MPHWELRSLDYLHQIAATEVACVLRLNSTCTQSDEQIRIRGFPLGHVRNAHQDRIEDEKITVQMPNCSDRFR